MLPLAVQGPEAMLRRQRITAGLKLGPCCPPFRGHRSDFHTSGATGQSYIALLQGGPAYL
eukprot:2035241-Amphidinium_carterae.2